MPENTADHYDDDYDPAFEEEKEILNLRRSAYQECFVLSGELIRQFSISRESIQTELLEALLSEEPDVFFRFADHFLPSEDARYSLDECPGPRITLVEMQSSSSGTAYLEGTCSKYSQCKGEEDLGREIEGAIRIHIDKTKTQMILSVEKIEPRTTLYEF